MGAALGSKSEAEIPQTCIFFFFLSRRMGLYKTMGDVMRATSIFYIQFMVMQFQAPTPGSFILQFQPVRLVKLSQALLYCICRWVTKGKTSVRFLSKNDFTINLISSFNSSG